MDKTARTAAAGDVAADEAVERRRRTRPRETSPGRPPQSSHGERARTAAGHALRGRPGETPSGGRRRGTRRDAAAADAPA